MTIEPTHRATDRWTEYRRRGWWEDRTRYSLFRDAAGRSDRPAIVDGSTTMTYGELLDAVDRVAAGLASVAGVGRGDVVAYQLPNWWETEVLLLACSRLGAVVNPLHLVYRVDDLRYVLGRTAPKAVFFPGAFGGTDYVDLVTGVIADLGTGILPVVVRPIESVTRAMAWDDLPADGDTPVHDDASAVALVLYTSGTTARPKGALHSDNTLVRLVRDMCSCYDLGPSDPIFIPSTMTHVSGLSFVWSAHLTGGVAVLLDRWDPARAMDVVLRTGATFVGGATPFIRGLIDEAKARRLHPDEVPLERGNCGSADVPATLIAEADEVLGAPFARGYGLTEGIIVSACRPDDTLEHRGGTDGEVLPVNEVRIVDAELSDLPEGERGEIVVRGPSNFLGYLDAADNEGTFLDGSWIRTGDVGILADGHLTIAGRIKDIVSRGGENISVKEIEDHLVHHDAVAEVAIVGMPDPVMGERCCAFIVVATGQPAPTLDELRDFLTSRGLPRQKLPERLEVRAALPLTSTGKVQKNLLRDDIARLLSSPTDQSGG